MEISKIGEELDLISFDGFDSKFWFVDLIT